MNRLNRCCIDDVVITCSLVTCKQKADWCGLSFQINSCEKTFLPRLLLTAAIITAFYFQFTGKIRMQLLFRTYLREFGVHSLFVGNYIDIYIVILVPFLHLLYFLITTHFISPPPPPCLSMSLIYKIYLHTMCRALFLIMYWHCLCIGKFAWLTSKISIMVTETFRSFFNYKPRHVTWILMRFKI